MSLGPLSVAPEKVRPPGIFLAPSHPVQLGFFASFGEWPFPFGPRKVQLTFRRSENGQWGPKKSASLVLVLEPGPSCFSSLQGNFQIHTPGSGPPRDPNHQLPQPPQQGFHPVAFLGFSHAARRRSPQDGPQLDEEECDSQGPGSEPMDHAGDRFWATLQGGDRPTP